MDKMEAMEWIWNEMKDWVEPDVWALLVEKYLPGHHWVFPMADFDTFCKDYFPGQYLTIDTRVAKSYEQRTFYEKDHWAMWNQDTGEITSTLYTPMGFIQIKDKYPFIHNLVMDQDPILEKLHVKEAIAVIRGENHANQ